jgi:hypothetical protein
VLDIPLSTAVPLEIDIMESSSSSNRSNDQMIRVDLESNVQRGEGKQPKQLIRLWKIPVPLRKGSIVSDSFKIVAGLMTAL